VRGFFLVGVGEGAHRINSSLSTSTNAGPALYRGSALLPVPVPGPESVCDGVNAAGLVLRGVVVQLGLSADASNGELDCNKVFLGC